MARTLYILIIRAFVDNDGLTTNTEHAYLQGAAAIIFYDDKSEASWSRSRLLQLDETSRGGYAFACAYPMSVMLVLSNCDAEGDESQCYMIRRRTLLD